MLIILVMVMVMLMFATWKVTSWRTGFGLQETPGRREQRFASTPIVIGITIIIIITKLVIMLRDGWPNQNG